MKTELSIIIPADFQEQNEYFKLLKQKPGVEAIFVGLTEAPTRAERLNLGFLRSSGSMILFHHPRSRLPDTAIAGLARRLDEKFWGGFTHAFDVQHPFLKFTSFYSNFFRGRIRGIIYLDHCIFFHRSLWAGPLPPVEIFEDTILSDFLRRHSLPQILPELSTTSAIRFVKNGIYFQSLMNQLLKLGYYLKIPHRRLNLIYEKGLDLNGKK